MVSRTTAPSPFRRLRKYPQVLEPSSTFPNGLDPTTLEENLGGLPDGVKISEANSASAGKGPGFRMIEDGADGNITIRWSPGSARLDHISDPYWRVSSKWVGKSRVGDEIPADEWPDEAPFWAARAGDTSTEPTSGEGPAPSGGGGDSCGSGVEVPVPIQVKDLGQVTPETACLGWVGHTIEKRRSTRTALRTLSSGQ
jgi:hypothetical protein